jgi:hypothetical protein
MAFYGPNNTLLIGDNGIVMSSFDSDGVVAESDGFNFFDTEFDINPPDSALAGGVTFAGSNFGEGVAVGSGRIVVGAPLHDGGANDAGFYAGYDLEGNNLWVYTNPPISGDDELGRSIAVGGGRIFASADLEANSRWISSTDLDGRNRSGIQRTALFDDHFASIKVAVGCGKMVAGLSYYDSSGTINRAGMVEIRDIYDNDQREEKFVEQTAKKLWSPDGNSSSKFGSSVAVGNGRILVGAEVEDSNGYPAYLFDLEGNLIKRIKPDNWSSSFGFAEYSKSTDIACGKIAIGAPQEAGGKVYVYDINGNELWNTGLKASGDVEWFGYSVAIGSNRVFVGDPEQDGDEVAQGKVWAYSLDGTLEDNYSPTTDISFLKYGIDLAVANNRLVVGTLNGQKAYGYKFDGTIDTYYEDVLDTVGNTKWE